MPTLYSLQAAKLVNTLAGTYQPVAPNEMDGPVRSAFFSYNQVNTEATNDTLHLCDVPAGARIIGVFIANEDLGTTVTIDIGDADDTDRLVTGFAGGTASVGFATLRRDDTETDETPTLGYGYRYTAATRILATLTSVSSPTANATIRGHILYVSDR